MKPLYSLLVVLLVLPVALIATFGCGQNANSAFNTVGSSIGKTVREAAKDGVANAKAGEPAGGQAPAVEPTVERKIIYTANLHVIVDDFQKARTQLEYLVKEQRPRGSFIARADITGTAGSRRQGTWTIRVPAEWLDDFLATLGNLGEVQRSSLESRDVTEEYYDVDARIKNKRIEEERLIGHLKSSTGKLDEILTVEQELNRVRGEAEHMQGRLNLLGNLSSLSTVQLQMSERRDYVPETTASFGATLSGTFDASLTALLKVGKGLLLASVAAAPWLVVLGVVFGPVLWVVRRRTRTARPRSGLEPSPTAELVVPHES